ncbi:hypothetical protein OC834_003043 [Tilletia horrida]|uniref:Flavoprotein domain-containing protein n=1 Tax=Tilletia horrida TaxID=155126 RepID=A0AAN6G5R0_9BASI|nr:hypothetical protein OC842_006577 [Tilletia horrida]KAK0527125.1 hypothetical protein OC835_005074 [Tilletia horrida]KAK0531181.1 hypothetical protein OC834_003043 [Tilletia horrida]KAK0554302.1 hypothetical protein OC844_006188 [Tilletia horrida]
MPLPTSLRSPYEALSSPPTHERPLHVVLACAGSVASVKIPLIVEKLLSYENVMVHVVPTQHAAHFWSEGELQDRTKTFLEDVYGSNSSSYREQAYGVKDLAAENKAARSTAFSEPRSRGRFKLWNDRDEWNDWSKVGDPVLHIETSFFRALSPSTPTLIFPAMNTLMYEHPLTARHLNTVQTTLGYEVHGPIPKQLACGDIGQGAMFEWTDIVSLVVERFGLVQNTICRNK